MTQAQSSHWHKNHQIKKKWFKFIFKQNGKGEKGKNQTQRRWRQKHHDGGVDTSEGDARCYHGRNWWREVKVRPDEGVAVVVGGVDADKGDARQRENDEEEEDRYE